MPFFTPGTKIATPTGPVPVEKLSAGDRIVTRDNGMQALRWVGARSLSFGELVAMPHLRPVLIRMGSLGHDLPDRDMMVSPNHRMLAAKDRSFVRYASREVLVPAKNLTDGKMIRAVDVLGVTYVHLMTDRHEVVLANGLWCECFQPEDTSLGAVGNAQRTEIHELFPQLQTGRGAGTYRGARRALDRRAAHLLNFSDPA